MTKPYEEIYDITTGKITTRDYTAAEIAEVESIKAERAAIQAEADEQAQAAATAKAALLARLGITADEAKLLLG